MNRLIFVLFAQAVACGACSGGDDTRSAPLPELEEFRESQLTSLLGVDEGPPANAYGELLGRFAEECMRERGFDVAASDLVSRFNGPSEGQTAIEDLRQSMPESAFTEQFGFGIARSGIENYRGGQDNPLQDYIAGLSDTEAAALNEAFFGDPGSDDDQACLAKASARARQELDQDRWQVYGVWAGDVQQRIDSDSRVVNLHLQYAECMASQGYAYTTPLEARFAANERFRSWASQAQVVNPDAEDHLEDGLSDTSRNAWRELQELEVEEAGASIGCEALIRSELVEIHSEVEQAWIAENAERIAIDIEGLDS